MAAKQVAGLMAVLDLRSAVSGSQAAARAEAAARPAALRVLCLLCQSGVLISRRLLFEGGRIHTRTRSVVYQMPVVSSMKVCADLRRHITLCHGDA